MQMQPVQSSMIKAIGYRRRVLHVTFNNGQTYEYKGVPRVYFDGLRTAPSKGRFFNVLIKGSYPYKELK